MRLRVLVAAMAVLAFGSGCATMPTLAEVAAMDFGPAPTDPDTIVLPHLRTTLRDPNSAQVERTSGAFRMYQNVLTYSVAGWGVCYRINARNAYGGYVGYTPYLFVIQHNRVVNALADDGQDMINGALVRNWCDGRKSDG
jgi:hypothetical protein